jgi:hypothetical protein
VTEAWKASMFPTTPYLLGPAASRSYYRAVTAGKPPPELESGSLAYEASTSPYMLRGRKLLQGIEPCPQLYKSRVPAGNTLGAGGY